MSTEVNSSDLRAASPAADRPGNPTRSERTDAWLRSKAGERHGGFGGRVIAISACIAAAALFSSGCRAVLPERSGIPTPAATAVIGGMQRTPTALPTSQISVIVVTATPAAAPTSPPVQLPEAGVVVGSRPPVMPVRPAPPAHAPCGAHAVHIVHPGETLYSIAVAHHTTVEQIMHMNGIRDPRLVAVGRRLVLAPCSAGAEPPAHTGRHYVVRAGDNLFRIGLRFGVSAAQLRAANGLPDNIIRVGQVLIIP